MGILRRPPCMARAAVLALVAVSCEPTEIPLVLGDASFEAADRRYDHIGFRVVAVRL